MNFTQLKPNKLTKRPFGQIRAGSVTRAGHVPPDHLRKAIFAARVAMAGVSLTGGTVTACGREVGHTGGVVGGGTAGSDPTTSTAPGKLGGSGNSSFGGSGSATATTAGGNATASSPASGLPACTAFSTPVKVGQAVPAALSTLSGLVASRSQPTVLYAHPDRSGAIFFAINEAGERLQSYVLSGYTSTDLEDIAVGPALGQAIPAAPTAQKTLYLGDIGDNTARTGTGAGRSGIAILRFAEPTVASPGTSTDVAIADYEILRLTYPDRPHDAESLAVDPTTGDILIVTREADGSAYVFSAPGTITAASTLVLSHIGKIQVGTTTGANAADISPSGKQLLIRTYQGALLYTRESVSTPWSTMLTGSPVSLPVAAETQSEGATFSAEGRAWLSSGEANPAIYRADALCAP